MGYQERPSEDRVPRLEVGWYVYCVIPFSAELPLIDGIDERFPLVMVSDGEIGAMASPVSLAEFGSEALHRNLEDIRWVAEKARRHEEIIEAMMRKDPVLPMRFGTIFLSTDRVRGMLRENSARFQEAFEYLRDKEEWGLKGFSDRHLLKEWALREDHEFSRLSEELNARPPGLAFFLKKKLEQRASATALEKEAELVHIAEDAIRGRVVDMVRNPLIFRRAMGREVEMVLNLACLVLKEEVKAFLAEVGCWNENHAAKGLELQTSGPWPPYNFSPRLDY